MQLSLLSAISRIRTITSLSKEMRGNYTTFAPEQTSRLIRYYATERGSVTAKLVNFLTDDKPNRAPVLSEIG